MKFENTEVFNFEGAFRGMRNPFESWDKSDSYVCNKSSCHEPIEQYPDLTMHYQSVGNYDNHYIIGVNDLKLAQSLILAGNDHSKFMRQIIASVDITAPLYWWKEFDTYKVGIIANSTSTMHKLATTEITLNCFEFDKKNNALCLSTDEEWGKQTDVDYCGYVLDYIIKSCEQLRKTYLKTKEKKYWRALIQLLPSSWLQTRTVTMSYQNIRAMYFTRSNHKLTEWSVNFANWVKTLPYTNDLILIEKVGIK